MEKETLRSKLGKIQMELKAPKNQYNSFGRYNYRSCEDILEALKPLLEKYKVNLIIKDDIVPVLDRVYVKANAILDDGSEKIEVSAFAREEKDKKGMDSSQITGAASSYARKYALNGLFLIDDTKDSDYLNTNQSYSTQKNENKEVKTIASDLDVSLPENVVVDDKKTKTGKDMWVLTINNFDKKVYCFNKEISEVIKKGKGKYKFILSEYKGMISITEVIKIEDEEIPF